MRIVAVVMALLTVLGSPPDRTVSADWETVAIQILEETPETAAQTLLNWAGTRQTAPEADAVLSLLEERPEEPAAAAAALAAVLDMADSLRASGGAPDLSGEDYQAAVWSLSPFFTRLLESDTAPWREESPAWPAELTDFDGIWCDSSLGELLIFRDGFCRVVIPYLGYYGETAFRARLRDRSGVGYCPSLEVDIHGSGDFSGPLAYYVSGLAEDHFWCNSQGQRFEKIWPLE